MHYPTIPVRKTRRQSITRFRGLNRTPRPGSGEFSHMENLSSDAYPVLAPRGKRGTYRTPASPQGLIARDQLCYVDAGAFVLGDTRVEMGLSVAAEDCPKKLQSMGAYVIILPDKKYINTAAPEDHGAIEAETVTQNVTFTLCRADGEAYTGAQVQSAQPQSPENGDLWLDSSASPPALKQYSSSQESWVSILSTYVMLRGAGLGKPFRSGDTVTVRGCLQPRLNGSFCLQAAGDDYVIVEGILEGELEQSQPVTLERRMPELDHITESGNRLWGCRYGVDGEGNPVNEIYACKLGDFRNWHSFQGLSTDSYAASCGTPGPFTGAASHMGYPVFFKEDCIHKVYGSEPAAYRVQTTPCRGVQPGCQESLALVGDQLIYRARDGICAYDGATSQLISRKLGFDTCRSAAAGALGDKYYISQERPDGSWELLVWDSSRDYWHREDSLHCSAFCALGRELFAIDEGSRNILGLLGSGEPEGEISWMAQTGQLGLEKPEQKHITGMTLTLSLEKGASMKVWAQYDDEPLWEQLCVVYAGTLPTIRLPLRPRRCACLRLRLEGTGGAKVCSITRIVEEGSDLP